MRHALVIGGAAAESCLTSPMTDQALARVVPGVLRVDDKEVASKKVLHTIPFLMAIDETFDVGVDTRTGVDDTDYRCRSASPASSPS